MIHQTRNQSSEIRCLLAKESINTFARCSTFNTVALLQQTTIEKLLLMIITLVIEYYFVFIFEFICLVRATSKSSSNVTLFSVWIGQQTKDLRKHNHCQYSYFHGYNCAMFSISTLEWKNLTVNADRRNGLGNGWAKVYFLQQLLKTTTEYILYLDIDCIIIRDDIYIEQFIRRDKNYSIFVQEFFPNSRMTQSHMILFRNTAYTKKFVQHWWKLRLLCKNLHMEQGSFYFTIAEFIRREYATRTSNFNCPLFCESIFPHNQCYADWMYNNKFGPGTGNKHPHIYFYPYKSDHISPRDGFGIHLARDENVRGRPFSIHACKQEKYLFWNPSNPIRNCT